MSLGEQESLLGSATTFPYTVELAKKQKQLFTIIDY